MHTAHQVTGTLVAAGLALGLAACSSDSPKSSSTTTSSSSTTTTKVVPVPDDAPFKCPKPIGPEQVGCFAHGAAQVAVTGSRTQTIDAPIYQRSSVVHLPAAGLTLSYAASDGAKVTLVDVARPATHPSSGASIVGIVTTPDLTAWNSFKGECTVTLATVTVQLVAGSFSCTNIPATKGPGTINATGTFTASP